MNKDKKKNPFDDEWSRRLPNGGASWAAFNPPREPEPVVYLKEDEWPRPKERTDLVFAKSCVPENWSCTKPGTATVPASDFGKIMLVAPMLVPSSIEALKLAVGFDAVLGRIAGSGLLQQGFRWALRGNPTGVFIAGMLPTQMGDGTLYKDDDLRQLSRAPTRVRFQFRRDAEGVMQVYGIHTGPSGDDSVRTVQVKWNASKTVLEADLNGITILWTPRGPLALPPLVHPEQRNGDPVILVHPIPENTDSQIEGYPAGDDIETDDCILVFPAGTGLNSLYIVFSKAGPRYGPGTVTGIGEDVSGIWLAGAGTGLGAPIPTRIADALRGREFSSFDKFREAFWEEVANDPTLLSQFKRTNKSKLMDGRAPFAPMSDHYGEKAKYEIHHIEHIQQGGAVYDVDNLAVMTPKRHVEIHKENKNGY
ncbi:hypothetical protein GCM10009504_33330 [Pseudomonas laurentiana]|uniref:S-type Pyocin n=1 Tax=Pseudomonas laurentiana TaxID=2364649 RepID=A0A6I5RP10_9PSED|nr:S-type pyocin domain-containing protein [Pseudomonas laurentiana]NES09465.1 S-type Pyocin [Pseudomonas laurentiana]GGU73255.1 hypothetical protein GCM10009504_33330 [Pseudomonas laurentiana]